MDITETIDLVSARSINSMADTTTHAAPDEAKVAELAESMRTNGWVGSPVLGFDRIQAITGVHRIAAAREAGIEVRVLWLDDIVDDGTTKAVEMADDPDNWDALDIYQAVALLFREALGDEAAAYGLDLEA